MPTTSGLGIRTIADIVQLITHCDKTTANAAEHAIVQSNENVAILGTITGIPINGVGYGGLLLLASSGKTRHEPSGSTIMPSEILRRPDLSYARRFCYAAIQGTRRSGKAFISRNMASSIGMGLSGAGAVLGTAAGVASSKK